MWKVQPALCIIDYNFNFGILYLQEEIEIIAIKTEEGLGI